MRGKRDEQHGQPDLAPEGAGEGADVDAVRLEQVAAQPVEIGADHEEGQHEVEAGRHEERADRVDPGRDLDGGAEGVAVARRQQADRQHRPVEAGDQGRRAPRQAGDRAARRRRSRLRRRGSARSAGSAARRRCPTPSSRKTIEIAASGSQAQRMGVDRGVDRRGQDVDAERHRHREVVPPDDGAGVAVNSRSGRGRHDGRYRAASGRSGTRVERGRQFRAVIVYLKASGSSESIRPCLSSACGYIRNGERILVAARQLHVVGGVEGEPVAFPGAEQRLARGHHLEIGHRDGWSAAPRARPCARRPDRPASSRCRRARPRRGSAAPW